ncbi:hypothetical protein [Micromonospora sp. NPDC000442]|uniref:hypothetical protein n=1 Tax=Micromonospora sp. NPDC000442 TaxID=3364217 RepID=UPI0036BA831A
MTTWEEKSRPDGDWIMPRGLAAVMEELELCDVPLAASVREARCRLELNGVWVGHFMLGQALRERWRTAGLPEVETGRHRSFVARTSSLAA